MYSGLIGQAKVLAYRYRVGRNYSFCRTALRMPVPKTISEYGQELFSQEFYL